MQVLLLNPIKEHSECEWIPIQSDICKCVEPADVKKCVHSNSLKCHLNWYMLSILNLDYAYHLDAQFKDLLIYFPLTITIRFDMMKMLNYSLFFVSSCILSHFNLVLHCQAYIYG